MDGNIEFVDTDSIDISHVLAHAQELLHKYGEYTSFVNGPGRTSESAPSLAFEVFIEARRLNSAIEDAGLIVPASADQILLRFGLEALAERRTANLPFRGTTIPGSPSRVDALSILIPAVRRFLAEPKRFRAYDAGELRAGQKIPFLWTPVGDIVLEPGELIEFDAAAVAEIEVAVSRLQRSKRAEELPAHGHATSPRVLPEASNAAAAPPPSSAHTVFVSEGSDDSLARKMSGTLSIPAEMDKYLEKWSGPFAWQTFRDFDARWRTGVEQARSTQDAALRAALEKEAALYHHHCAAYVREINAILDYVSAEAPEALELVGDIRVALRGSLANLTTADDLRLAQRVQAVRDRLAARDDSATSSRASIADIIGSGDTAGAVRAFKRYLHNKGAELGVGERYQGAAGPEPIPSELTQLAGFLQARRGGTALAQFIRQDQRRLSSATGTSGFVLPGPFSKADWQTAALLADEWLNEALFRDERERAVSSPQSFRAYLQTCYDAGDISPLPSEDPEKAIMDNWRGIIADTWNMARELGRAHHAVPPSFPLAIDSEAAAESAIDQLMGWTYELERAAGSAGGPPVPTSRPPKKALKEPSKKACAVYRYQLLSGKNQTELATDPKLMELIGRAVTQGSISRYLSQVKEWVEAGNVLPNLSGTEAEKPTAMDPERIDLGRRQRREAPRQRPRQSDDD